MVDKHSPFGLNWSLFLVGRKAPKAIAILQALEVFVYITVLLFFSIWLFVTFLEANSKVDHDNREMFGDSHDDRGSHGPYLIQKASFPLGVESFPRV